MAERWLPVLGYEELYEVSDLGRVRRLDGRVASKNGSTKMQRGMVRSPYLAAKNGYPQIRLSAFGRSKSLNVHRLVCEAFHGPRPSAAHQVAHVDGSRNNNRAENLRWATAAENAADRKIHGTERQGEQIYHRAKLTADQVRSMRSQYVGGYGALTALARKYGITSAGVYAIVNRKNWKHIE